MHQRLFIIIALSDVSMIVKMTSGSIQYNSHKEDDSMDQQVPIRSLFIVCLFIIPDFYEYARETSSFKYSTRKFNLICAQTI